MMTTQEFKDRLQGLVALGDDFGALVFFAIRNEDGIVLKKANIINDVLTEIASGYRESIQAELNRFLQDDHMSVLNLSDRDERENVIYRYDIPDVEPSYFAQMREPVAEEAPEYINDRLFQFDQESFGDIDYFVVMLGTEENHVVVYRDNFNVHLLKQARGRYYLNKSGTQITNLKEDILRMDSQIDCMLLDDDFFIVNLKNLNTSKEFATIIKDRANQSVDLIADLEYIDNVDGLRERLDELSFARRLMKAMDGSPVIGLPTPTVLDFVSNNPKLNNVLKVEGGKIKLDTKKAQSAFVSLLNDDFLYSKLTNNDYESSSKDRL
jgi:hypothetical protein